MGNDRVCGMKGSLDLCRQRDFLSGEGGGGFAPEALPVCSPSKPEEGWVGLQRIGVVGSSKQPFTAPLTYQFNLAEERGTFDKEIAEIVAGSSPATASFFSSFSGVCRSEEKERSPGDPLLEGEGQASVASYQYFAYKRRLPFAGLLTYANLYNPQTHGLTVDSVGFRLKPQEMEGLASSSVLHLNPMDAPCMQGSCPASDGAYVYQFTTDARRLEDLAKTLRDDRVAIGGITMARRQELADHLDNLRDLSAGQGGFRGPWAYVASALAMLGVLTGASIIAGLVLHRKQRSFLRELQNHALKEQERISREAQERMLGKEEIRDPLSHFGRNLTEMARKGLLPEGVNFVGGDDLMLEIGRGFGHPEKPVVGVDGDAGRGKSAAVQAFVVRAEKGTLPPALLLDPQVRARLEGIEFHEFLPERLQGDGIHLVGKMNEKFEQFWKALEALAAEGRNVGVIVDEGQLLKNLGRGMNSDGLIGYLKKKLAESRIPTIIISDRMHELTSDPAIAGRMPAIVTVSEKTPDELRKIVQQRLELLARAKTPGRTVAPGLAEAVARTVLPASYDGKGFLIGQPRRALDAATAFFSWLATQPKAGQGEIGPADFSHFVAEKRAAALTERETLSLRLGMVGAGQLTERLVVVLERMVGDLGSEDGRRRVKTLLAELEDPTLREQALSRAEILYGLTPRRSGPFTDFASGGYERGPTPSLRVDDRPSSDPSPGAAAKMTMAGGNGTAKGNGAGGNNGAGTANVPSEDLMCVPGQSDEGREVRKYARDVSRGLIVRYGSSAPSSTDGRAAQKVTGVEEDGRVRERAHAGAWAMVSDSLGLQRFLALQNMIDAELQGSEDPRIIYLRENLSPVVLGGIRTTLAVQLTTEGEIERIEAPVTGLGLRRWVEQMVLQIPQRPSIDASPARVAEGREKEDKERKEGEGREGERGGERSPVRVETHGKVK